MLRYSLRIYPVSPLYKTCDHSPLFSITSTDSPISRISITSASLLGSLLSSACFTVYMITVSCVSCSLSEIFSCCSSITVGVISTFGVIRFSSSNCSSFFLPEFLSKLVSSSEFSFAILPLFVPASVPFPHAPNISSILILSRMVEIPLIFNLFPSCFFIFLSYHSFFSI